MPEADFINQYQFNTLFEESPMGLVVLKPDGLILKSNHAFNRMLERESGELIYKAYLECVYRDDLTSARTRLEKMLSGGIQRTQMELRYTRKSGKVIWGRSTFTFLRNPGGSVRFLVGVIEDITLVKLSQVYLKTCVENIPAAVAMFDREMRYIITSRRWREDYQLEGENITGRLHYEVLPHTKERWRARHRRCLAGSIEKSEEDRITLPDGREQWVKWEMHPWRTEEGYIGGIILIRDNISERKKVEDLLKQYKDHLEVLVERRTEELRETNYKLQNLSSHLEQVREQERKSIARDIHDELGQSLTALRMDLSWMLSRLPDSRTEEKARSMIRLVDSTIKSVQRISSDLRPGILDDLGLLPAMEWYTGDYQKRTGLRVRYTGPEEETEVAPGIATAMYRLLQEALTNVARHAEAREVDVRVHCGNAGIELMVSDDGKGIPPEALKDSRSYGLMGMRERVRSLNGQLSIEGNPKKGTVVRVTLPLRFENEDGTASPRREELKS